MHPATQERIAELRNLNAAVLIGCAAFFGALTIARAQDALETDFKQKLGGIVAVAKRTTESIGDDRPIAVFPILRIAADTIAPTAASDHLIRTYIRPALEQAIGTRRVVAGDELDALLKDAGRSLADYDSETSATLLGSIIDCAFVVSGTIEFEKTADRQALHVVIRGSMPGLDGKSAQDALGFSASADARLDGSVRDQSPMLREVFKRLTQGGQPTSPDRRAAYGGTAVVSESSDTLFERVLIHRGQTFKRFATRSRKLDGAIFLLPPRSKGEPEFSAMSDRLERALAGVFPSLVSASETDRMLDHEMEASVLFYRFDMLEPETMRRLAEKKRTQPSGCLLVEYATAGSRVDVFLTLEHMDGSVSRFSFAVDHALFGAVVKESAKRKSEMTFVDRKPDAKAELLTCLRTAQEEIVAASGKAMSGKVVYVAQPIAPSMTPAHLAIQSLQSSLFERRRELLDEAAADPKRYPKAEKILDEKALVMFGMKFDSWRDAKDFVQGKLRSIGLERNAIEEMNVQSTLCENLKNRAADLQLRIKGAVGRSSADTIVGVGSSLDPQAPLRRVDAGRLNVDLELISTIYMEGDTKMSVSVALIDSETREEIARSKPRRVRKACVEGLLARFVVPNATREWTVPADYPGLDVRLVSVYYAEKVVATTADAKKTP